MHQGACTWEASVKERVIGYPCSSCHCWLPGACQYGRVVRWHFPGRRSCDPQVDQATEVLKHVGFDLLICERAWMVPIVQTNLV